MVFLNVENLLDALLSSFTPHVTYNRLCLSWENIKCFEDRGENICGPKKCNTVTKTSEKDTSLRKFSNEKSNEISGGLRKPILIRIK